MAALCSDNVHAGSLRPIVLAMLFATSACIGTPGEGGPSPTPSPPAAAVTLGVVPPLLAPDGRLRVVTTPTNWLQGEDSATGAVLWTRAGGVPAASGSVRWRVLFSADGTSLYVQSLSDERGLTYLGTRRIEPRTGAELANDLKFESYWYENVVLWTALRADGKLQMAVQRPVTAGGGYWLRTLDPRTLKTLADGRQPGPPPIPAR